jgi:hypothetical protein
LRYSKKVNDQKLKRRLAWLKNADKKNADNLRNPKICGAHSYGGIDISTQTIFLDTTNFRRLN